MVPAGTLNVRRLLTAAAVSVAAHTAVVAGLTWSGPAGRAGGVADDPRAEREQTVMLTLTAAAPEAAPAERAVSPTPRTMPQWPSLPEIERRRPVAAEAERSEPTMPTAPSEVQPDRGRPAEVTAPPGVEPAEAAVPEVALAGMSAGRASVVVYVIDGTGSMLSIWPSVVEMVERSVSQLDATQRFQLVVYTGGGVRSAPGGVGSGAGLIRGFADRRAEAVRWLGGVRPAGVADPAAGLREALSITDGRAAVFLISKPGGAHRVAPQPRTVLAELESLNPRRGGSGARAKSIRVVQLIDEDPTGLLATIAGEHGGDGLVFLDQAGLAAFRAGGER